MAVSRLLRFQARRKLAHVLLTAPPLALVYLGIGLWTSLATYSAYLAFWLASELLRTRRGLNTPTAMLLRKLSRSVLDGSVERDWKRVRFPYWIVGSMVAMPLGPLAVVASTVCLSFGDPSSGMVKALTGRRRSPVATGTGMLVSFAIMAALTSNMPASAMVSVIGMCGDLVGSVNDNLSIPVLGAAGAVAAQLLASMPKPL